MSALDAPTQGHPHAYIVSGEQNETKTEALPTVTDNSMQQTIEAIPWGLHWRASVWFITLAVGLGITTDLLVYSILIPVLPFQLETLGHTGVSALTGYLLFAYSGGLVISTPPIAWLSERYKSRQWPLIVGLIILIGSQVMLMEAPAYWVMAFARVLQGIGSSVVWVVALALLCDTAPEKYVGRQLGIAMSGFSLGLLVGPPVGGALYTRFGFRGPCIFSIIFTLLDLLARLLIIERKDALRYRFDPAAILEQPLDITTTGENIHRPAVDQSTPALVSSVPLSPLAVIWQLAKSLRALTALLISFVWGIAIAGLEPTLPLHLQAVWDLDSSQVGLVFVAAVVPTLFSSPLAGWWADKKGAEWATVLCISLSLPWWGALIIRTSFALFVVIYAFQNFFSAALVAPITAELAAVTRSMPSVGYAHVYGAFNLAYGVGSTIGPIIGGQVYNHVKNGWVVLCFTFAGLFLAALGLSVVYAGEKPIFTRLMEKTRRMKPITLRGEATKDAEKPMVHVECNARLEEL